MKTSNCNSLLATAITMLMAAPGWAVAEEFRALLVRTYAVALAQYQDQKIIYLPLHAPADVSEVTVRTEVWQSEASVVPIDYRLHLKGHEWKVYDVIIDGVSLIANYRTTFAQEIRRDGIDSLIQRLSKHNQGTPG